MGTRVGCEYETTTQSTKDIDAFTVHITPRAMLKRWDTGPPTADTDAFDKSWDTGQPPADIDAAQDAGTNTYTHTPGDGSPHTSRTHTAHTHTYKALGTQKVPVHPLTPAPNQTQITPPSPMLHTRAAERAAFELSNQAHIHRRAVGRHTRVESGS